MAERSLAGARDDCNGPRRAHRIALPLLGAAALAAGGPLAAQPAGAPAGALAGVVRDSVTRQPLAGAVVLLRDSLDRAVGQGLTDERGRYRVPGSAAARRVRVLRMGFRPAEAPLPPGGAPPDDVALAPVPPLLAPVRVTAAARCPRRTNTAAALGLLEQVRAGLLATVVAGAEHPAATVLSYERHLDPRDAQRDGDDARVVRQTVRTRASDAVTAPFGAGRSGAEYVDGGFRRDSAGRSSYDAPDAATLVDDDFAAGYCFRVVAAGADRPHQVGLGFAAARPRAGRTDVDGVLWVDTVARALRDLGFRYTGVDPRVAELRPGGRLAFRQMPNGVAFIDRWALRLVSGRVAPDGDGAAAQPQAYGAAPSPAPEAASLTVHEVGGELARVAWPDGRAWRAPLGALRLRLTDAQGRPAAGAEVRLDSTDYVAVADSAGVAVLADLLPGPYTVRAADPPPDALGRPRPATLRVVAVRDSVVEERLMVAATARVAAAQPPAPSGTPRRPVPRAAVDTSSVAIGGGKTIERLFTGRFPGVTVMPTDGGGLQIRIRGGAGSFMAGEEPLYIVDGVPLGAQTGGIVFLNPYDIDKIEVLKNPADVAVYGVRGANGVILITTLRPGRR